MTGKHHIEQEFKLTAPNAESLVQLLEDPLVTRHFCASQPHLQARSFMATYYDCPNWTLRHRRWSLRTRYEGSRHVGTLKRRSIIKDGFSSCEEYEQPVARGFERVDCIPAGHIADSLLEILPGSTPLLKRVKVHMSRHLRLLEVGSTKLELVTDHGQIFANGKQMDLFEVELELMQGDLHDRPVQDLIKALRERYALYSSDMSKHQLGLTCFTDLS